VPSTQVTYVRLVRWLRFAARSYGIDALIVLGALISALIVILGGQTENAPTSPLWFAAPAAAVVVLPLLWRRRFPFGGPASVWLIAAVLSFVDGRLVAFPVTVYIAGMAAAYLLGNLSDGTRAGFGLVVVLVAITIIMSTAPTTLRVTMCSPVCSRSCGWPVSPGAPARREPKQPKNGRRS
jgi:hypothetical protein